MNHYTHKFFQIVNYLEDINKKMENKEELIEKEIRTIIPILARRCGILEDEVVKMMLKVCNEKCVSKL